MAKYFKCGCFFNISFLEISRNLVERSSPVSTYRRSIKIAKEIQTALYESGILLQHLLRSKSKKNKQLPSNKNLQSNHWKAISKITNFKSLHAHFPEIRGCLKKILEYHLCIVFRSSFRAKNEGKKRGILGFDIPKVQPILKYFARSLFDQT